jgi:hypothetical protein
MRRHADPAHWVKWVLPLIAFAGLFQLSSAIAAPQAVVPALPTSVTHPPAGKGVPFNATPIDLKPLGYVEEEFVVSGKANVYQYGPNGTVTVKTPNVPYTTRILVRRPINPKRFSGTVRFETSHPQYGIDFVWSRTIDYALAHGDAVVSVAMRRGQPSAIEAIKRSDPVRYAAMAVPEDGLNWDIISQVGRLLKSRAGLNPLSAYGVRHIIAQGWSGGAALLLIYVSDGFHDRARMPSGGPIVDGYLVGEPSGYPKINSAAAALSTDDPRQKARAVDVPVISLHTRPQESYRRRPDGNGAHDRYRVYEVAGAAHNDRRLPFIYRQSDSAFGQAGCVAEVSRFPMHHFFKSTLARLDRWVLGRIAPPASQRIALKPDGTIVLDANGNPAGGVRSSYVDVPIARYYANAPAAGAPATPAATGFCALDGAQERFSPAKLRSLYRTRANYAATAIRRLNQLERAGWLLPADAQELRKEAVQVKGF